MSRNFVNFAACYNPQSCCLMNEEHKESNGHAHVRLIDRGSMLHRAGQAGATANRGRTETINLQTAEQSPGNMDQAVLRFAGMR